MVEAFPDLDIFPGAEVYLLKALSWGARGCISASANINAYGIRRLLDRRNEPDAPQLQEELNAVRKAAEARVMIPSLKAVLAERYRDPVWLNVRPPLTRISETHRTELLAEPAIRQLLEMAPA
jgi:4-hydroxy-tetrahydrodipicolinate synthase